MRGNMRHRAVRGSPTKGAWYLPRRRGLIGWSRILMSDKQTALQIIEHLPETASLDDIVYELYVRSRIERGLRQADAGLTVSNDEVMKSISKWLRPDGQ